MAAPTSPITTSASTTHKPRLSFWQIWNMSFGFMGVQYGFGLQQANMSPIYSYLGADPEKIPYLWLAGPVTGLLVQPIIGVMSDKTWTRLGRRRPYFLVGAIIASVCLIAMPNSTSLWMAAGLMWIMDAAFNTTMEPFRAFVADKLPPQQRTTGFAMQSFFVGFGQTLANVMPWLFATLGVVGATASGIPLTVKYSFLIGAGVYMAAVLWTVYTTDEYPPADMAEFNRQKAASGGILSGFSEITQAFRTMPTTMRRLFWVKFFTWYGFFCYVSYFALAISHNVFNVPGDKPSEEATIWGNICFAIWNVGCFVASPLLPLLANKVGRKATHAICLTAGGVGLVMLPFIQDKYMLFGSMLLVGLAWASILSMPYAILANAIPENRMGVYMGIFNMFIVIPQIIMMLTVPLIYKSLLGDDPMHTVVFGGICWLLAAAACFLIEEHRVEDQLAFPVEPGGK